jgi:hypothetical protein
MPGTKQRRAVNPASVGDECQSSNPYRNKLARDEPSNCIANAEPAGIGTEAPLVQPFPPVGIVQLNAVGWNPAPVSITSVITT